MMDAPLPTTTTTNNNNVANSTKQAAASVSPTESPTSDLEEEGNPQQGTEDLAKPQKAVMVAVGTAGEQAPPALNLTRIPPTIKDSRKLFVGGLPQDVTSEEFRTFFETFGAVADSVVMMDRETNRSRGFGFVTFEDAGVSERVLALRSSKSNKDSGGTGTTSSTHLEMRGKLVEIKSAEPKALSASTIRAWRRGGAPRKNWQPTPSLAATPVAVYPASPVATSQAYYIPQYQPQQQQQPRQAHYPPNSPFISTENDAYNNLAANYSASAYGYAAAPYSYYNYGYTYEQQQGVAYGYYHQQQQYNHQVTQANPRHIPDTEKNKEG